MGAGEPQCGECAGEHMAGLKWRFLAGVRLPPVHMQRLVETKMSPSSEPVPKSASCCALRMNIKPAGPRDRQPVLEGTVGPTWTAAVHTARRTPRATGIQHGRRDERPLRPPGVERDAVDAPSCCMRIAGDRAPYSGRARHNPHVASVSRHTN